MPVGEGRVLAVLASRAKLWPGEGWRWPAGLWPSRIAPTGIWGGRDCIALGGCWLSSHRDGASENRAATALPSLLAEPDAGD